MAVDGNISIYRFTTDGQTETGITDKVEFDTSASNGAAVTPDNKSHVDFVKVTM